MDQSQRGWVQLVVTGAFKSAANGSFRYTFSDEDRDKGGGDDERHSRANTTAKPLRLR